MGTPSGDKTVRRHTRGRPRPTTTMLDVGLVLRGERERLQLGLAEIHDRSGVPWQDLEAIESADLAHFGNLRSALLVLRRYADLVGVDAGPLAKVVEAAWPHPESTTPADHATGHLSRYPGDRSHLYGFTQTAEVPGVAGISPFAPGRQTSATTGPWYSTEGFTALGLPAQQPHQPRSRPVPLGLRLAVWLTALALALAAAGLAVDHWRPQWLVKLHLDRNPSQITGAGGSGGSTGSSVTSISARTVSANSTGATVAVSTATFSVEVAAFAPCWVQAESPASSSPLFSGTMGSGTSRTFAASSGQLTVQVGASSVLMTVKANGRLVRGWFFRPSIAPYVVSFVSARR